MSSPVVTVDESDTIRRAATLLADEGVGSAVVTRDGERPTGIITESDLVRVLASGEDVDGVTVDSVMTRDLVTRGPEEPVEDAAATLSQHGFRRLPIVDADELVGIVTTEDLSYYLPRFARRGTTDTDVEPRYDLRPETAYESENWEFECHVVREDGLSPGDVVRFTKTISETDVERFAEASGDTNRLHLEEDYAAKTRFGRRIAHGTLVSGLISAALARLPGLTIYLTQELTFSAPVDIGDRVTAVCEVVDHLGVDRFHLRTDVVDSTGTTVVEGEAVVIIDDLPAGVEVAAEQLP